MASELGYRICRLRRLIGVCLGLLAVGVALGLWFVPGEMTALQFVCGAGLFSIFAMAHLGMILIWPADPGGPLAYAIGTLVLLSVALPAGAHQLATGTGAATLLVIGVIFGPLIWLSGAVLIGSRTIWLISKALPTKQQQVRVFDLPLGLPRAMGLFAMDPNKRRALSMHGPVGPDGCFEGTAMRLVADPKTGVLREQHTVVTYRTLASDAATRSVLITRPVQGTQLITVVFHQQFEKTPKGTRLTERLDITGVPGLTLLLGLLWDGPADWVTAELDADAGRAPRAICHLPMDSMILAMTRLLKWGNPQTGQG